MQNQKPKYILSIIPVIIIYFSIYLGELVLGGIIYFKIIQPREVIRQKQSVEKKQFNENITKAKYYYGLKEYNNSLNYSQKVLSLASADIQKAQAYYWMGINYYFIQDFDKAKINSELSLKFDPKNPYSLDVLSAISIKNKEYEKALDYAKHLTTALPKYDLGYMDLAIAYSYLGQKTEAIKSVKKAIELSPQQKEFQDYLKQLESSNPSPQNSKINSSDNDISYWQSEIKYMSQDSNSLNVVTNNSSYDQQKINQLKSILSQRMAIANQIYTKLSSSQTLSSSDYQSIDNYYNLTDQFAKLSATMFPVPTKSATQ